MQTLTIAVVFILAIPYGFAQGYHHHQPFSWQVAFNIVVLLLHLPILIAAYEAVDFSFQLCIYVLLALWLFSVVWHALVKEGAVRVVLRVLVEVWYSVTFVHLIFLFVTVSALPLLGVVAAFFIRLVFFARAMLSTEPPIAVDHNAFIRRLMRALAWTHEWWLPPGPPASSVPAAVPAAVEQEPAMPPLSVLQLPPAVSPAASLGESSSVLSPQLPPSQLLYKRPGGSDAHEAAFFPVTHPLPCPREHRTMS